MPETAAGTSDSGRWTTPKDVVAKLRKRFDRGEFLISLALGADFEPVGIALRGPTAGELGSMFEAARAWVRVWESAAPQGVRLEYREVGGRVIGANRLPARAWVDGYEQLWSALGVAATVRRFTGLLAQAQAQGLPAVRDWAAANPIKALGHAGRWSALLATVAWIERHQRPDLYVRQVDVPGVDTKFIEANRAILTDLLEVTLDPARIEQAAPRTDFVRRFRFEPKPEYIRARTLDPSATLIGHFTEASLRVSELAEHSLAASRVLVVENETTYLALPPLPDTVAIWGGGYAVNRLAPLAWLADRDLLYWGDIDTHGFAILNRLRAAFPAARSVLMDRATLMHHRSQWVRETTITGADLPLLTADEQQLYRDLAQQVPGPAVRLEQERIGFGWIETALHREVGSGRAARDTSDAHRYRARVSREDS